MQPQQLKGMIENGRYRPQPELVARAMLRRRGVRELLAGAALSSADRSPSGAETRRQAA